MSEDISVEFIIPQGINLDESQKVMLTFMKTLNTNMTSQFTRLNAKLEQYNSRFEEVDQKLSEANKQIESNTLAMRALKVENSKLKSEINMIKDKYIRLEGQSRRENLIFSGVSEDKHENCEMKIRGIFQKYFGITDEISLERCHRMGPKINYPTGQSRNIIVKFSRFPDRQMIWKRRDSLKSTKIVVFQDFPQEIQQRRQVLKPVLKEAVKHDKSAYLVVDKLYIENKVYTVETMDNLPDELNPAKLATPQLSPTAIGFYGMTSPLSNFHRAPLEINGVTFEHVEQYYQYERARYYGDGPTASKILSLTSPYDCYFASKSVKRPAGVNDDKKWHDDIAFQTMLRGCTAKFQQNPHLGRFLLSTADNSLVEVNPNDNFWGAGRFDDERLLKDSKLWPGKNMLGQVLELVRTKLKSP
jgi:ribA/ribD-fused uncharacterized protein